MLLFVCFSWWNAVRHAGGAASGVFVVEKYRFILFDISFGFTCVHDIFVCLNLFGSVCLTCLLMNTSPSRWRRCLRRVVFVEKKTHVVFMLIVKPYFKYMYVFCFQETNCSGCILQSVLSNTMCLPARNCLRKFIKLTKLSSLSSRSGGSKCAPEPTFYTRRGVRMMWVHKQTPSNHFNLFIPILFWWQILHMNTFPRDIYTSSTRL